MTIPRFLSDEHDEVTYQELRRSLNFAARLGHRLEPRAESYYKVDQEMKLVQKAVERTKIGTQILKTLNAMLNGRLVHKIHFLGWLPFDNHKIMFAHLLGIALELREAFACTLHAPLKHISKLSFMTKSEHLWLASQPDVKVDSVRNTFFEHSNLGVEIIFAADLERYEYLDYILWKNREKIRMSDLIVITNDFTSSLTDFNEDDMAGLTAFAANSTVVKLPSYRPFQAYRLARLNWDHLPENAFDKLAIMQCQVSTLPEINWDEKSLKTSEDTLLHEARAEALFRVHKLQNETRLEDKSDDEVQELINALPLNIGNGRYF